DDVAQDAGALLVVVAAVVNRPALGEDVAVVRGALLVRAVVRDAVAVDYDAAPLLDVLGPDRAEHCIRHARKGDRRIGATFRDDPRAAVDDEIVRLVVERE